MKTHIKLGLGRANARVQSVTCAETCDVYAVRPVQSVDGSPAISWCRAVINPCEIADEFTGTVVPGPTHLSYIPAGRPGRRAGFANAQADIARLIRLITSQAILGTRMRTPLMIVHR